MIDGWFMPDDPANIYAQGKQNDVPILVGSNKDEGTFFQSPTTAAMFTQSSKTRYNDLADAFFKLYPASSDDEATISSFAAFRDQLGFVMRNWAAAQTKTGKSKAYVYYFTHEPPIAGGNPPPSAGSNGSATRRHARRRSCIRFRESAWQPAVDGPGSSSSPTRFRPIG